MKAMTLRLSDELHEALRREAFETRTPINELVRRAIEGRAAVPVEAVPVPPSAPIEPYPVDLIVQIVSESGPMPSRGVLDEAQRKYSISEAQAKMALSRAVSSKRLNRDRETWEVSAPSAPTPDENERDALVVEYEVAWSDFEALGEENRDLRWRDFLLDRLITAGYRSTPTPNVAALIEGLRVAMLGTEDGDFIDPNSEIPAGEMFRLASEYVAALRVVETVSTVEDVHALPIKTLIVSQKGERVAAWREDRDLYDGFDWVVNGDSEFRTSEGLADLLPALVFRPTREEG